jgi:hypothetical protein
MNMNVERNPMALRTALVVLAVAFGAYGCKTASPRPPVAGEPAPPTPTPVPTPPPSEDPLAVSEVKEPLTVAAWAEPAKLPPLGGQCQIIVRVQKRGGAPFAGVEVRLSTSKGTLFSAGKTLVTDASGRTRDRLTAREIATITLNAGGTRYRFEVPLAQPLPLPE